MALSYNISVVTATSGSKYMLVTEASEQEKWKLPLSNLSIYYNGVYGTFSIKLNNTQTVLEFTRAQVASPVYGTDALLYTALCDMTYSSSYVGAYGLIDFQSVDIGSQSTSSLAYVDVVGSSMTTKNLGESGKYEIVGYVGASHSANNRNLNIELLVNGVSVEVFETANKHGDLAIHKVISGITAGQIIKLRYQNNISGTMTILDGSLSIKGFKTSQITP